MGDKTDKVNRGTNFQSQTVQALFLSYCMFFVLLYLKFNTSISLFCIAKRKICSASLKDYNVLRCHK